MSDSGANTAAAVTMMVSARGTCASHAAAPDAPTTGAGGFATVAMKAPSNLDRATLLRSRERRFPVAQEFEPFLLIEIRDDLGAYRNRFHIRAELFVQARRRVFRVDVVSNREELDVAADQLLTSLRKYIIGPELGGVRILRLLADEHHAREDERVVLGQYDAEVGIFFRADERI